MFSDLATIRAAVKDLLTPILPNKWKPKDSLEGTVNALTPVWYIEFTRLDSTEGGAPLGRGQVAAGIRLIVTDPKKDTSKAEDDVDQHVLTLILALDPHADLFWSSAEKRRLDTGELAWAVELVALVETPDPEPEPEPDPAPEPEPEE